MCSALIDSERRNGRNKQTPCESYALQRYTAILQITTTKISTMLRLISFSGGASREQGGGGGSPPKLFSTPPFCPPLFEILQKPLVAESHGCRNHTGRGATFVKNGQMLLKHLSWIGKIVKIYEMFLKKYIFCEKCLVGP